MPSSPRARMFEELDAVDASQHAVVRTDRDLSEVVDNVEAYPDRRLLR